MATGAKPLGRAPPAKDVDVVVIGNGPSSIALSLLLSGHRPYWNGRRHPNEYLSPKLANSPDQSILDQDLELLSEGLTGRSSNPVSLLFDQLLLPNADLGSQLPPVIEWRYHRELAIDHVVLGRGCVGGSWGDMPADLQSLSYAEWLQLPDLPIADFIRKMTVASDEYSGWDRGRCGIIAEYYQQYVRHKGLHARFICGAEVTHIRRLDETDCCPPQGSPFLSIVDQCHCCVSPPVSSSPAFTIGQSQQSSYLDSTDLSSPPTSEDLSLPASSSSSSSGGVASDPRGCMSTSSSESISADDDLIFPPIAHSLGSTTASSSSLDEKSDICSGGPSASDPVIINGGNSITDVNGKCYDACRKGYQWSVRGCRNRKPFHFNAKYVVLACGTSDEPRRLNVPGEGLDLLSYGCPSPGELRSLAPIVSTARPLIVVGCGLTAADTILLALQHNLPVIHVFGRAVSDTSLVLNRMPRSVYPEYVRIGKLMSTRAAQLHSGVAPVFDDAEPYVSLPCHHVISVSPSSCILQDGNEQEVVVACSHIFVAAGSRPNLSFLSQAGQNLAIQPGLDFDCRANPVAVDPLSFESTCRPDLYAMGPLVGDNFVRFAIGASLGITKSLSSKLGLQ